MTDFSDAAGRHWNDGEHLHVAGRLDNADQLFCFAAECAIKTAIVSLSGIAGSRDLPESYRSHIDTLWNRVPVQALAKTFPAVSALVKQTNPFSNWCVAQRYQPSGTVTSEVVAAHRKMAQRLLGAVQILGTRLRK